MGVILGGVNFIFFFVNQQFDYSFPYIALVGYTTFAMMFGLLVYEAVSRETRIINYIFGWSVLKFFGRISYGLYIFHWPVYIMIVAYPPAFIKGKYSDMMEKFSLSILATVIAIIISLLSYYFFERYFLKWKERYAS